MKLATVVGFIKKEMRQTLRDPRMRVLLFVAPCMQMTLFGVALSTETRNVRLAVAATYADPILKEIKRDAIASQWFIDMGSLAAHRAFNSIRSGRADAVLVPPLRGLSQDLGRDGYAELQFLIEGTNVTRAQGIERYLRTIIQRHNQEYVKATTPIAPKPSLGFDVRVLYNPSLRSAVYLVPGIMSVVMCLITILLTSMSITREKELGTFEAIISAPLRASDIIFGKVVPYIILGMANIPLILSVAVFAFDVPMRGAFSMLSLCSLIFIGATVCIGIFISTITRTQQQAMMGGFIYLMPSLLISGLLAPVASMPWPLQTLAYLNPLTYYMALVRNIMLKGGDFQLFIRYTLIMAIITLIIGAISVRRFRTTLS